MQIRRVFKIILIWISIDLFFYIIGLVINFLITIIQNENYFHFDFRFHLRSIIFQFMIFSIFSLMTIKYVDKKYFLFFYPITLTIIYNLIFIFNLGIDEGQILFLADDSGFSIKYLLINGQTIPDILNSFMPLEGIFDGGIFCPNDTAYFYILWILLPILYYFGLSWITNKIINMNKSNLIKKYRAQYNKL